MSVTEKRVCGLTLSFSSSNKVNCTSNTMPILGNMDTSDLTSNSTKTVSDHNGSGNGVSKEISNDFKQTLMNIKALNGQTKYGDDKRLQSEDDIVILDDVTPAESTPKVSSSSPPALPASLLPVPPKPANSAGDKLTTSSICEPIKTNKFEINDRVRSSFKDIMSKIQETPSLHNLLSKTKDLDTKERKEERERLERLQQAAKAGVNTCNTMGKGSGDNVFENLKELNCDTDIIEQKINLPKSVESLSKSPSLGVKPDSTITVPPSEEDVILLDSPDEDVKHRSDVQTPEPNEMDQNIKTKPGEVADKEKSASPAKDCDKTNTVQSTTRDTSPICIDCDTSLENESPKSPAADLKAEEELLKVDQDKENKIDTDRTGSDIDINSKEEEERLLASESDEDVALEKEDKIDDVLQEKDKGKDEDMQVEDTEAESLKEKEEGEEKSHDLVDSKKTEVISEEEGKVKEEHAKKDILMADDKENGENETKIKGANEVCKNVKEEVKMELDDVDEESQSSSSSSGSDESSKSQEETKVKEEKTDEMKSEVKSEESNESSDRKRPADSTEVLGEPKRSRLDMVIGKLGTAIGIQPDSLKDESEEDMSDIEESHESEVTESVKSEDTSTSVSEDDEDVPKTQTPRVKKRKIRMTESELEQIVRIKVKAYLKIQQEELYQEIAAKMEEMSQSVDFWKTKYREMERQVNDVTILQQKHEKRKAKTAALRELSTKNVAVQVDENKTNYMSQLGQQSTTPTKVTQMKTPPKSAGTFQPLQPIVAKTSTTGTTPILTQPNTSIIFSGATVPPKLTPMTFAKVSQSTIPAGSPCLVQSLSAPVVTPPAVTGTTKAMVTDNKISTVKNLLDTKRQIVVPAPTPGSKVIAPPPVSGLIPVLVTMSQPIIGARAPVPVPKTTSTAMAVVPTVASRTGEVVDLTGEEDSSMKRYTTPTASTALVTSQSPAVAVGSTATTVQPGAITSHQIIRPSIPTQGQGITSNSGILLSTPAGTQIVRNPQQTFQLVFNSSSPAIRPGSLLTVMSAPGSGNPIGLRPAMTATPVQPPPLRAPTPVQNSAPKNTFVKTTPPYGPKVVNRHPPPLQVAPPTKAAPPAKAPELVHPAPLPVAPADQVKPGQKPLPPKPTLKISRVSQGIVLSWNMTLNQTPHAEVASYQLFAYQEGSSNPSTALWKKVGDVKALPLPMACTLTQFQEGNRYHFAVRAVDVHNRVGPFSEPNTIHLTPKKD